MTIITRPDWAATVEALEDTGATLMESGEWANAANTVVGYISQQTGGEYHDAEPRITLIARGGASFDDGQGGSESVNLPVTVMEDLIAIALDLVRRVHPSSVPLSIVRFTEIAGELGVKPSELWTFLDAHRSADKGVSK